MSRPQRACLMPDSVRSASVRVPATSANLGPGFDSFGLALTWYDTVHARVLDDHKVQVEVSGSGAATVPRDETHLVVRALRAGLELAGRKVPGVALRCVNEIPHGKGLGSSAAAITAGLWLARALGDDHGVDDHGVDDQEWFALAARLEGHPDNVAACWYGGLTLAWGEAPAVHAACLDVHPDVHPLIYLPTGAVPTTTARAALPPTVPHRVAAASAAQAGLMIAALTSRPDLLLPASADFLHQDYRRHAMPETHDLVRRLRADNVPAVISGAGPAVLAFPERGRDEVTGRHCPPGWTTHTPAVARGGARLLDVGSGGE